MKYIAKNELVRILIARYCTCTAPGIRSISVSHVKRHRMRTQIKSCDVDEYLLGFEIVKQNDSF